MNETAIPDWKRQKRHHRIILAALLAPVLMGSLVQRNQRALFLPTGFGGRPGAFVATAGPAAAFAQIPGFLAGLPTALRRGARPGAYFARPAPSAVGLTNGGGADVPATQSASGAPGAAPADQLASVLPGGGGGSLPGATNGGGAFLPNAPGGLPVGNGGSGGTTPVAGAVPEPGTWAMMVLGAGIVGLVLRRRRKAAANA